MSADLAESDPPPTGPPPAASSPPSAVAALGLAMIVLAAVRGWPPGVALAAHVRYYGRQMLFSTATVPWEEFAGLGCAAWPAALGAALIVSRSSRWLRSAAIACLALGAERGLTLAVGGLFDSGWSELYRGTRDFSLGPVLPRGARLILLVASVAAWLALGVWAWRRSATPRRPFATESGTTQPRRRRERPSYADLASSAFAAAVLMLTGWITYGTILERLPWVRALILSTDRRARDPAPAADSVEGKRSRQADSFFAEAGDRQTDGDYAAAKRLYTKSILRYEALVEDYPQVRAFRGRLALAANNCAWMLATCPDPSERDPDAAAFLARRAVALDPGDGNAVNTLAVALFRQGDVDGARAEFEKSMALRDGGDSFDWFFLAQVEAGRGHAEEARRYYDRAVTWARENRPSDGELFRFQVEAAGRLGLPEPKPPAPGPRADPDDRRIFPIQRGRRRFF